MGGCHRSTPYSPCSVKFSWLSVLGRRALALQAYQNAMPRSATPHPHSLEPEPVDGFTSTPVEPSAKTGRSSCVLDRFVPRLTATFQSLLAPFAISLHLLTPSTLHRRELMLWLHMYRREKRTPLLCAAGWPLVDGEQTTSICFLFTHTSCTAEMKVVTP